MARKKRRKLELAATVKLFSGIALLVSALAALIISIHILREENGSEHLYASPFDCTIRQGRKSSKRQAFAVSFHADWEEKSENLCFVS